jgi:hypothetical protein
MSRRGRHAFTEPIVVEIRNGKALPPSGQQNARQRREQRRKDRPRKDAVPVLPS